MAERTDAHPRTAAPSRRWPAVISLAVLGVVSLVAGASAQLNVAEGTGADTRFTPRAAEETTAWVSVAGAEFGADKVSPASWTPVEAEFYSVAFENETHGFAAGSQCVDPPDPGLTGSDLTEDLESCQRRPAIYEYRQSETDSSWHEVLPADGPGYVGAVAFMRDGSALAVGGTGTYPKREPSTGNDADDDARAWLYQAGIWIEVDKSQMQPGMRGLTSVAVSPRPADCVDEAGPATTSCGLAGGYRQLWMWKDNKFVTGWGTADAPDPAPSGTMVEAERANFRYRVRDIEFVPGKAATGTKAVAVTAGCCESAASNVPRLLLFNGSATPQVSVREFRASEDATVPADPVPDNPSDQDALARRDMPDSLYSLMIAGRNNNDVALLATPGGAVQEDSTAGEPQSRIYGARLPQPNQNAASSSLTSQSELLPEVSTIRLTSIGGRTLGDRATAFQPGWAVGSMPREEGQQGIAYTPWERAQNLATSINVLSCPGGGFPVGGTTAEELGADCEPYEAEGYAGQTASKGFYRLPSYALNAFTYSDQTESVGWAVGDRGAIVRVGGIGTTSASSRDPAPAKLGGASLVRFAGSEVYDPFRPLPTSGATAPVPSLASNGTEDLERPELTPGGSPNPTIPGNREYPKEDVSSVAMSPDGSEGWAVGAGYESFGAGPKPGPMAPTLYHYDGSRWSRCDTQGIEGVLPADPACARMSGLFGNGNPAGSNAILRFIVRVPLENDDEPSNDQDFEAVAVGTDYNPPGDLPQAPVVARYTNGQWSVDELAQRQLGAAGTNSVQAVAFTAPDDGWLAIGTGGERLMHWDGETWWACKANPAECGDTDALLPDGATSDVNNGSLSVAGKRVYFATGRFQGQGSTGVLRPLILYKDLGDSTKWTAALDQADGPEGTVRTVSVVEGPNGHEGWAVGHFGGGTVENTAHGPDTADALEETPEQLASKPYQLLRLSGGSWTPYTADDASSDYLPQIVDGVIPPTIDIFDPETGKAALYAQDTGPTGPGVLLFEPTGGADHRGRWRVFETPFHMRGSVHQDAGAYVRAVVPDGDGGAWLVAKQRHTTTDEREAVHFWRYADEAPKPVFDEAPHPIRESMTAGAAGPDGSYWITTNSGIVYRYDRLTGWDRLRVPGWDPGRVVTRTSEANAVAVGPDGEGVVVGKNGRLAQVSALGVRLDPAASKVCGDPPCGTSRDLRAAAVAPDGSALVGGDASVLLFRPAGGVFRRIDFGGSETTSITAISMPSSDRAWLTSSRGQVYAGRRAGDDWEFFVENRAPGGKLLSLDENDQPITLRGIEIDESGEGYAVGERGLILERRGDAGWQRIKTPFMDTFRSVGLAPEGRQHGALIGGDMGLILTLENGEFRVAREADHFDPLNFGAGSSLSANVVSVEILPGVQEGQVEAWAVQQVPQSAVQQRIGPGAVLHYTSDPDHTLMRPGARIEPLPDAPEPRPGEISFAAFGRSECHGAVATCPEGQGANLFHEVVSRRVAKAIIARSGETGGPAFAVFTGDVGRAAGRNDDGITVKKPLDKSWVHRRWTELVADRFADAGVPLFGAVGLNDLDRSAVCSNTSSCEVDSSGTGAGLTTGWRRAMADMAAPWGDPDVAKPPPSDRFRFQPVAEMGIEQPVAGEGEARTHYAVDLNEGSDKVARVIVLDNSMRTLRSSDPNQNPLEPDGQEGWLDSMLAGVDQDDGQQAIVVMNTPTYSNAAGDPTTWAGDATPIEEKLMSAGVKMVVSGRLGWNGRYWATTPGVHHPCPGGAYIHDDDAPEPDTAPCSEQTAAVTDPATQAGEQLANALTGAGAPPPPGVGEAPDTGLRGLLPFVVASSAGGRFGPDGTEGGPASDGWWHGYTIVRLDESGDPRKTIVEQRPIFDWVSITAATHVLKPRQRMTLRGEGREPVGMDVPARYDAIDSPAITHRYDLFLADEQNPSVPRKDENGELVKPPPSVGTVDRETGVVVAGNGRQERTYTVAVLSVGDKVATWPIVFEPAKSFKPRVAALPIRSVVNTPPRPVPARPLAPPITVQNQGPAATPPDAPPPPVAPIQVPSINLPPPPSLPPIPTLPGGTPTPTPPPPAAPPPPPGDAGALPLSLQAPLNPVSIVTTVIPPSPPPVNPAPPGGSAARKEARQRQAATAKSEEGGGDEGAGEGQSSGESGSNAMTRRDRARPAPSYDVRRSDDSRYSFTAVSHEEQASAWSRGALYGGMAVAGALVLALGWGTARPTPKRRHPPRPAPQTVRTVARRPRH
jgi:hypothetical protein